MSVTGKEREQIGQDVLKRVPAMGKICYAAVKRGNIDILKLLERRGFQFDTCMDPTTGRTPLDEAVMSNKMESCRFLLQYVLADSTNNDNGRTALFAAAELGFLDICKCLVEHGADPDMEDIDGMTPLFVAVRNGQMDIVEYFLQYCNVDCQCWDNCKKTPLHHAASKGHLKIVQLLLESGVSANPIDKKGWSPLMAAVNGGHLAVVKEMLNISSVDINQVSFDGMSPLSMAVSLGDYKMTKFLINNGAHLDMTNFTNGWSPLFYAVQYGRFEVAHYLLLRGADPVKCDHEFLPPIYHARIMGNQKLQMLILCFIDRQVDDDVFY